MSNLKEMLDRLESLKARRTEMEAEVAPILAKSKAGEKLDAGQVERCRNVSRGLERIDDEIKAADADYAREMLDLYTSGHFDDNLESGDGRKIDRSYGGGFKSRPPDGFGKAFIDAGWNLKTKPSVEVSGYTALKANSFPAGTDWSRSTPNMVPMGYDRRWLWPLLARENAGNDISFQDFKQSARTLTGTVQRAIDATTTKANVDVTVALVNEALAQFAVTINSVPNALLEGPMTKMAQFLQAEGEFQVNKALDDHVLAQIVAATPPFGNTGTTIVDKIRNGITAMRATGANPTIAVLNPADMASLDLLADAGGYVFRPLGEAGESSPLWGLRVVERIGGGTDPMYLIDPAMLGVLYIGRMSFAANPFTEFAKNLTTLRIETNAIYHIRNVNGARRIAAS